MVATAAWQDATVLAISKKALHAAQNPSPVLSPALCHLTCFAAILQEVFPAFFARVLALRLPERQAQLAQHEQTAYLLFMINAFQSLEDEMVRGQVSHAAASATGAVHQYHWRLGHCWWSDGVNELCACGEM